MRLFQMPGRLGRRSHESASRSQTRAASRQLDAMTAGRISLGSSTGGGRGSNPRLPEPRSNLDREALTEVRTGSAAACLGCAMIGGP
jgi:hypothetical protein